MEFKSAEQLPIPVHYDLGFDLLAMRKKDDGTPRPQSPSRLEKLLVSPLAWLLSELGASHLSWQPETLDVMLRGSLAHEVFERLFQPGTDFPDDATIDAISIAGPLDYAREQAASWLDAGVDLLLLADTYNEPDPTTAYLTFSSLAT